IMERLGFKKESDDGTKAAFVKNLIKQAYGVEVPLPPQYELMATAKAPQSMEELNLHALEGRPLPQRATTLSAVPNKESQLSFNLDYAPPGATPNKAGSESG